MATRSLNVLHPALRAKCQEWLQQCAARGLDVKITCTGRSLKEQEALYAQGRRPLSEVNTLRLEAGLFAIDLTANRMKVTWTLNSQHLVDPVTGFCSAFDFCLLKDGVPHWDLKVNVNSNHWNDYLEAALIAKELGLDAGAFWNKADYPHIQLLPEV